MSKDSLQSKPQHTQATSSQILQTKIILTIRGLTSQAKQALITNHGGAAPVGTTNMVKTNESCPLSNLECVFLQLKKRMRGFTVIPNLQAASKAMA